MANNTRGIKCNAQRNDDEFLEASLAPQDFWSRYLYDISPRRHYKKWKNGRALDRYVGRLVDDRIINGPVDKSMHHAIDEAISFNNRNNKMDGETRDMLIASVKTLIFAEHDTSASTLCVSTASPM